MSEYLPFGGFKFSKQNKIDEFDVNRILKIIV